MATFWSIAGTIGDIIGWGSVVVTGLIIIAFFATSIRDRRTKRRAIAFWRQRIREAHNEEHRSGSPLNERWPA